MCFVCAINGSKISSLISIFVDSSCEEHRHNISKAEEICSLMMTASALRRRRRRRKWKEPDPQTKSLTAIFYLCVYIVKCRGSQRSTENK